MLGAVFIDYERKPNRCGVPPDNAYSGIDSEQFHSDRRSLHQWARNEPRGSISRL